MEKIIILVIIIITIFLKKITFINKYIKKSQQIYNLILLKIKEK